MPIRIIAALLLAPSLLANPARAGAVPESIRAEGVPEIPEELSRDLGRYQDVRMSAFQDWLGDRRELLILTRFAATDQVHLVAAPGGMRAQLTFLPDRVLGALSRPRHGEVLVIADEGGAENNQFYLQDAAGATRRLTDGTSRHMFPKWSNSERLLAYSSNARNATDMDLYVMDPADPKSARLVTQVSGDWRVTDWSPDDRRLVALEYVSINESYVHLIDLATGKAEAITPRAEGGAPTVSYGDVRWAKDGTALIWTSDRDAEFRQLVRYDLATKRTTRLSEHIRWDVTDFDLGDDGRTVVLVANEDGISRLHVLDAVIGVSGRPAPVFPPGVISNLKFRRHSQEFGLTFSANREGTDAYSVDLLTGAVTRWVRSEAVGLPVGSFAEPELVRFQSFDGREIPAFVYRPDPKFAGPRPVLIQIHGGPEGQSTPGFLGKVNYLVNDLGIAVIYPNVRGSAGYGKTYLKLDNGPKREDAVKDIGALLDWIATRPDLDASRVAVAGGSYGGFMTLATLTHYSDRLKAGIDLVGISNFRSFLRNTKGYRRDLRRAEYGDERDPEMNRILEQVSPLTGAGKIAVPLMVVAGQNDPRVPASESEQVAAAVRRNGVPVWFIVGTNEGHGFAKKENQDYLHAAEVLFLKRFLLGEGGGHGEAGATTAR